MSDTDAPASARHDQMFPTLGRDDVARVARLGEPRRYAPGEALFRTGDAGVGLSVIVQGRVSSSRHDATGATMPVADHRAGAIVGETSGLSGRSALVDGVAVEATEAVALDPAGLRALLLAEAMLGERIVRALILRRVDLIGSGAGGSFLIAPADHPGRAALANFLARNGFPFRALDPASDHEVDEVLAPIHAGPDNLRTKWRQTSSFASSCSQSAGQYCKPKADSRFVTEVKVSAATSEMERALRTRPTATSVGRDWSDVIAQRWQHDQLHGRTEKMAEHVFMTYFGAPQRIEARFDNSPLRSSTRRGAITLIPAGHVAQ